MGIPNALVQEHNEVNDYRQDGKTLLGYGYIKNPYVLRDDGMVRLSEAPGLGFEVDEESIQRMIETKEWTVARG
jgi:galactonate dehydratase